MKIHPRKQHLINVFGHDPESLDEVAQCVITIIDNALMREPKANNNKVVGFSWDISHSDQVSNSHQCPLDGHTNWGGRETKAQGVTSYPGWSGRVWIRYKHYSVGFSSDAFRNSLTYPGTGGAGGYNGPWDKLTTAIYEKYGYKARNMKHLPTTEVFSWDYRFFNSDFPSVKETDEIKKIKIWNILKGIGTAQVRHKFLWNDPQTEKFDRETLHNIEAEALLSGIKG
jgi:hypothetical protein